MADIYPMAETLSHFIEREAVANWCRKNWSNGQRLRTIDTRIEELLDSHLQLRKIPEACDQWETWWMNENQLIAACKCHPWESGNTDETNYWIFDTQNSVLGEFTSLLKTQNIDYSVDLWMSLQA